MNRISTNQSTCHPDATHTVVRERGNRIRTRCGECLLVAPWKINPDAKVRVHPTHDVPAKVNVVGQDYEALTVAELHDRCTRQGINLPKKTRKADLIAALKE